MMDIDCIPPPPPEEFEEPSQYAYNSAHDVPLPPGETTAPFGYGGGSYSSGPPPDPAATSGSGSSEHNRGMEWQRAMEALNQSNASKTLPPATPFPAYASPYGYPQQQYTPYGYGSNYNSGYQQQQPPPPGYAPVPTQSYQTPNYAVQFAQAQTSSNSTFQSSSATAPPPPAPPHYPPRTPQNSFARTRPPRQSKFSPYPEKKPEHTPLLPTPPSVSSYLGSAEMETDGGPQGSQGSYGGQMTQQAPQKYGAALGGIRFQLSKTRGSGAGPQTSSQEIKVSNPLLQRRQLQPQWSSQAPQSGQAPRLAFSSEQQRQSQGQPSTQPSGHVSRFGPAVASQSTTGANDHVNVEAKNWPLSLQEYVTRALQITSAGKRDQVLQVITQMITNAYKTNTINTVKWEAAPMPYSSDVNNELFGLSPKRENDPPSRPSSARGRGRGSNSNRARPGRGGRPRSPGDSESEEESRFYSVKTANQRSESAQGLSRKDSDRESEHDFIPLGKNGSMSTGKKPGKVGKAGKKAAAAAAGPRGKLMGFGTEATQTPQDLEKLRRRQERFGDTLLNDLPAAPTSPSKTAAKKSPRTKLNLGTTRPTGNQANRSVSAPRTVLGTCETVEKDYFRLTDHVDPSQVRPVRVLQEALKMVQEKWKKQHDYRYAESQLKSIRQDLRVQHVFKAFTVKVYECHARIALEVGDQAEFTQCLSQLEWLYDTLTQVAKRKGEKVQGCENRREFLSYRILYVMRQNRTTDAAKQRMNLSAEDKADTCIAFAFSVLSAYFAGDYQQFFTLYKFAPLMASYVMDVAVPQFRQKTLIRICTAYRPNLPVMALKDLLCFSTEKEMRDFLRGYKLTYTSFNGQEEIDTKASLAVVKAGPEAVVDTPIAKPTPIQHKPNMKGGRTFTAKVRL